MIDSIEKLIHDKKIPKVLLIFGEEEFLVEEAYSKLIKYLTLNDPSKSDFEILNAEENSPERIVDSCSSFPFLAEKRVVVVTNFDKLFSGKISKKTETSSSFAKYLSNPMDSTILILKGANKKIYGLSNALNSKRDKAKGEKIISSSGFPYNIILNKYEWIEFPKVWENQFAGWLTKRLKSFGKTIDPEAAELFIIHSSQTLRDLNNEIDKLLIYLNDRNEIKMEDIDFLIGSNREFNVFELQKAVGSRNLKQSIKILENLLAVDRKEMLILTVLTNYFISMLKLIEESAATNDKYILAGKLRISPAFVPEYLSALKLYTVNEIENAFNYLTETDLVLKSSSTDSLYILEKMLINIIDRKN
jgi:DNA polymerase III subunit delta